MTPSNDDTAPLPNTVPSFMCPERATIARRLGVSEERLKKAVRAVGSKLTTVKLYLGL